MKSNPYKGKIPYQEFVMNNLKIARGTLRAALCVGTLILAACSNPADPSPSLLPTPNIGVVRITIAGQEEARTVLPGMTSFVKYTINFVHEGGASAPRLILDAGTPASEVELKPGKWTVIIEGWVAADISTAAGENDQDVFADLVNTAAGSTQVTVMAGETADARLTLNKILDETAGSGGFTWDVGFPAALVETAQLTLSRLEGGGGFKLHKTIALEGGATPGRYQGSETLRAGYYRADVTIAAAHFATGRTVVAYIYPRMETRLPPIVFAAADIPSPPALPPGTESEPGSIAISIGVNEETAMNITYNPPLREGEAVILSDAGEGGYPAELTVTVAGFSDVLCLIDGVALDHVNGNTGRFVIKAAELNKGPHYLTVVGINDGDTARSAELPFAVIRASSEQEGGEQEGGEQEGGEQEGGEQEGGEQEGSGETAIIEADSVAALRDALGNLPENTAATAYAVKLSGIKISSSSTSGNTLRNMYDALNRYVTLDLRNCEGETFAKSTASAAASGKAYIVAVRLGEGVTSIAIEAFSGCGALVKAEFPGVISIGNKAFEDCAALKEITFGNTPPSIGASSLPSGPVFTTIFVPNGAAQTYQSSTANGWTVALKALVREISN
jgi:hypothetical protein